ncbi:MAG TPA: methionine biosynthesis protein MetW [Acidimicrobiales bacterium]|nr:methionine biosynthesis protein MetW [Acidimicrobiales bacterium]
MTTDDTAGGDEEARAYLDRVRREIDDEVRRRRAAGDFPPSFERRLDELFARFTPTGTADDHFTEALKLADRSAYFDIDVPIGPRRAPRGFVKWSLWQAEAWFMHYVVSQLNHFAASAMRVLHLLDERLSDVERDVSVLSPPPLPEEELVTPGADPTPFASLLVGRLHPSQVAGSGRVLHAECGDGALLLVLRDAGIDAYGIDPGTAASDRAVEKGLDVRRDDVLGHLGAVAGEALAGLVLSACVDRLSIADRRQLIRLAEAKVAPGALVAVVGTAPAAWERRAGAVASDLAPGRPWHAATWAHLLAQVGFSDVEVVEGGDAFAVVASKSPTGTDRTLASNDSRVAEASAGQ